MLGSMQFNFDIPLDCKVMGNYNLLNAMLMNLARNAAAYSTASIIGWLLYASPRKVFRKKYRVPSTA